METLSKVFEDKYNKNVKDGYDIKIKFIYTPFIFYLSNQCSQFIISYP